MKRFLMALALICAPATAFAQKTGSGEDLSPVPLVGASEPAGDQVIGYHDADARMNGAIDQARALLPIFLEEFRTATSQSRAAFTVKVALPTAAGTREHIWVGDLSYQGSQLVGNLINEPYDLPGFHLGSRVEIDAGDISDWTIATPDGVYGGFTTRVMLDDMPAAEAAQYRQALQMTAQPVPPGWIQ